MFIIYGGFILNRLSDELVYIVGYTVLSHFFVTEKSFFACMCTRNSIYLQF